MILVINSSLFSGGHPEPLGVNVFFVSSWALVGVAGDPMGVINGFAAFGDVVLGFLIGVGVDGGGTLSSDGSRFMLLYLLITDFV
jgi:hypothetical protein